MIEHLHVAVIGDNFVGTQLFEDALDRHVRPLGRDLTVARLHVPWPDVPLVADAEVKEYLGEPAEVAALVKGAQALVTHVGPVTQAVIDAGVPLLEEVSVLKDFQGLGHTGPAFLVPRAPTDACAAEKLLRDIGVTGVLNKPFDPLELLTRLPRLAA